MTSNWLPLVPTKFSSRIPCPQQTSTHLWEPAEKKYFSFHTRHREPEPPCFCFICYAGYARSPNKGLNSCWPEAVLSNKNLRWSQRCIHRNRSYNVLICFANSA